MGLIVNYGFIKKICLFFWIMEVEKIGKRPVSEYAKHFMLAWKEALWKNVKVLSERRKWPLLPGVGFWINMMGRSKGILNWEGCYVNRGQGKRLSGGIIPIAVSQTATENACLTESYLFFPRTYN